MGPFTPPIRAQKLLRLFAALLPAFTFPVTAIFSLDPGFSRLYEATPLRFSPPVGLFPSLRLHAAVFGIFLGVYYD